MQTKLEYPKYISLAVAVLTRLLHIIITHHSKYREGDKSRRVTWVGHVACIGEIRNNYLILVGKP